MTSTTETHGPRPALAATLVVCVLITCIDAAVLWRTRDRHLGVHEDHFDKGVSLYETGSMSAGSRPMVFRPPGYPLFVAGTLAIRDAAFTLGQPLLGGRPDGGRRVTVLAAHAGLLGLLGAAIFWFAVSGAGRVAAAACAVAAGCNPLLLQLAGHVSYELLHLVVVTVATLVLLRLVGGGEPGSAATFGNGLVWGAITLVKSVTLIAPAFVLLWASIHYGLRKAARTTALFAAGLFLVVAPYTVRNYVVADRFIPVNEQASFALWGTSLERIPPGADYLQWVPMWFASAMPVYTAVTGQTDYLPAVFEDHVLELSDRFRVMAGDNLRRDPTVYIYNALHNSALFVIDPPWSFYFERYPWPRNARTTRVIAGLSIGFMAVIALLATLAGCVRRDRRWTLVFALFAMMWAAHALTFLEARYLYIKLPSIVAAFVLACVTASAEGGSRWRRGAVSVAMLAALLSVGGLLAL